MKLKLYYERPETEKLDLVIEENFCGTMESSETSVSDPWDSGNKEEDW